MIGSGQLLQRHLPLSDLSCQPLSKLSLVLPFTSGCAMLPQDQASLHSLAAESRSTLNGMLGSAQKHSRNTMLITDLYIASCLRVQLLQV